MCVCVRITAADCVSCVYKELLNAFAASVSFTSNDVFLSNEVKASGKHTCRQPLKSHECVQRLF